MGIKNTIIKIFTALSAIAAAVFYVFFQKSKTEKLEEKLQETEKEKATAEAITQISQAMQQAEIETRKENEEQIEQATSGHKLNNYHAAIDFLSK